jgi:hypothetical protein
MLEADNKAGKVERGVETVSGAEQDGQYEDKTKNETTFRK